MELHEEGGVVNYDFIWARRSKMNSIHGTTVRILKERNFSFRIKSSTSQMIEGNSYLSKFKVCNSVRFYAPLFSVGIHCQWLVFRIRCSSVSEFGFFLFVLTNKWARGSVLGWGTMLQARRSRVQFPMKSLHFSIDLILVDTLRTRGRLSL
jgi:hypothetical protein